jgi:hypothetical protein
MYEGLNTLSFYSEEIFSLCGDLIILIFGEMNVWCMKFALKQIRIYSALIFSLVCMSIFGASITNHPKTTKITPGFYFRKADDHNDLGELNYNEYNWMYIKQNYEVQFFFTLDAEHCLVDLVYEKSPQQIYRNIKRNKAEFLKLIGECNKNEHAPYYRNVQFTKVSESSLFFENQLDSLFLTEEICFFKKGAILKITGTHGELYEDVYEFAGP